MASPQMSRITDVRQKANCILFSNILIPLSCRLAELAAEDPAACYHGAIVFSVSLMMCL